MPGNLEKALIAWFDAHARDLPWRHPDTTAWGVLVSEVMAQQTPVERVAPSWKAWMELWPTPLAMSAATPAEVLRMWGRLGYPRRALRLREAAVVCVEQHHGQVPQTLEELLALPGVGEYTAAAVMAFAHKRAALPLDTNVRRVLARHQFGQARVGSAITKSERDFALTLIPARDDVAAEFAQAVMELGALVCTATQPQCSACPIQASCLWLERGKPEVDIPKQRTQKFVGTDRQVRGLLMAVLREQPHATKDQLDLVWADAAQRERALTSLIGDGLVEIISDDLYQLPTK